LAPPAKLTGEQRPDSKLTAMGKDERAISVSGYVHRGPVKYTERAFEKTVIYKQHSRNHLVDQVLETEIRGQRLWARRAEKSRLNRQTAC
jgi:hypothetical protein